MQALDGGGKVRVSTSGGFSPEWGKDGRRLYFIQPGPPDWLISVPVEPGSRIAVGDPQNLLELTDQELGARTFDTTSDGGFFILRDETPDYSAEPLIVVRGWTSELKARSNGTN